MNVCVGKKRSNDEPEEKEWNESGEWEEWDARTMENERDTSYLLSALILTSFVISPSLSSHLIHAWLIVFLSFRPVTSRLLRSFLFFVFSFSSSRSGLLFSCHFLLFLSSALLLFSRPITFLASHSPLLSSVSLLSSFHSSRGFTLSLSTAPSISSRALTSSFLIVFFQNLAESGDCLSGPESNEANANLKYCSRKNQAVGFRGFVCGFKGSWSVFVTVFRPKIRIFKDEKSDHSTVENLIQSLKVRTRDENKREDKRTRVWETSGWEMKWEDSTILQLTKIRIFHFQH